MSVRETGLVSIKIPNLGFKQKLNLNKRTEQTFIFNIISLFETTVDLIFWLSF